MSGFDYGNALILQGMLFGVACFLCAVAVGSTHGFAAGAVTFGMVFSFGAHFVPSNMTETLGLILGSLAFTSLWVGLSDLPANFRTT